ncbi:MAG: E3 binding domain-containing protein, partial [Kiritimatiellae bacterium]|nr:E3 binding domain-containing protein [Kiritimatiellia bacterium]
GETVAELTTDKALYELEAPASGILLEVLATEKSVVPTGYIIGLIGEQGDSDPDATETNARITASYRDAGAADTAPVKERAPRVRATPRARRLARERGVDLAEVQAASGVEVIDETVLEAYLKDRPAARGTRE